MIYGLSYSDTIARKIAISTITTSTLYRVCGVILATQVNFQGELNHDLVRSAVKQQPALLIAVALQRVGYFCTQFPSYSIQ